MLGRIVKREALIVVRSTFRDVSCPRQGNTHEAMPDHQRDYRPWLVGQRQELCCKVEHCIAVEPHIARDPEALEDREQQQWIFGRLSERFSLFDQQTRALHGRLSFGSGIPFDMDERGYERDLQLDLFATQRRSAGQGLNLRQSAGELRHSLHQRRATQGLVGRLSPPLDRKIVEACQGEMVGDGLGLDRRAVRDITQELGGSAVQS
jgi:hypothetical protein